jgi:hypothetical protein
MAANATAESPVRLPAAKQPPENSVWIRYHPWIEGALSFISSNALHALVIGGAVLWSTYLIYAFGFAQTPHSLPVEPVRLAVPTGDSQPAAAAGDGHNNAPPKEAVPDKNGGEERTGPISRRDVPQLPEPPKEETPEFLNPNIPRINPGSQGMEAFKKLDEQFRDMHKRMGEDANPSNGNGAPGSVAGKGQGPGAGKGPEPGAGGDAGGVPIDPHQKRMMRWSMRFNTHDGGDYLRQLEALGVVLAIPDGRNSYKVVDLTKKPFQPENQTLSTGKKIWWFDNDPHSVEGLMKAMELRFRPQRIVAFIPREVEEELAKKELETGLKEDDIFETTFSVRVPGAGGRKYDVSVIDQKAKKEMKR